MLLETGLSDPATVGHPRSVTSAACCVSHPLEEEFLKKSNQSPLTWCFLSSAGHMGTPRTLVSKRSASEYEERGGERCLCHSRKETHSVLWGSITEMYL